MENIFEEDIMEDYSIYLDPDVILQDYDEADEDYRINEEKHKETDIEFE